MEKRYLYSRYFLAKVQQEKAWLVSGTLHYCGHTALERGVAKDIFEFFVPDDMVKDFLFIMNELSLINVVLALWEEKNRYL